MSVSVNKYGFGINLKTDELCGGEELELFHIDYLWIERDWGYAFFEEGNEKTVLLVAFGVSFLYFLQLAPYT